MASYSSPEKSKSTTQPVFRYLPGQEAYVPEFTNVWKRIFGGEMSSPEAQAMQTVVGEAGMTEAAKQRQQIGGTRGMTTPAKQRAIAGVGEGAVKAMAGVPQEMWKKAAEYLSAYTTKAPAVGSTTIAESKKGAGFGICCFIFLSTDPTDELLQAVRRYKDSHYDKESIVAHGYKRLAIWLVPSMHKYNVVKQLVKYVMVHPMELYAKAYYDKATLTELMLYPIAHFWVAIYWTVGKFYGEKQWTRYQSLKEVF
jgi:hypothetical protein